MLPHFECNGDNSGSAKENILPQKVIDVHNENNGHANEFYMSATELSQKSTPSCSVFSTPTSDGLKLAGISLSNSLQTPSLPSLSLSSSSSASSTSSTTSLSTSNGTTTSNKLNGNSVQSEYLLQWKDMPNHLQFNPYVLTGYRPLQSFKGCVFSLFYWHNETVNILTHGIPIVYILYTVPALIPWEKDFRFLSLCHLFGAVAPWCGSFVYHLFMNLEKGEDVYYRLLKIDMLGIWVSQSFGALPMITATCYCLSSKWKWMTIIAYCLLSIWGLYKAMTAVSPWERRLCFLLPFTMRAILTLSRTFRRLGGSPEALTHVYLQATISDFEWMSKAQCNLNNASSAIDMTIDAHNEL